MVRRLVCLMGLSLASVGVLASCETISQTRGMFDYAKQFGAHLEEDLKSPLTNELIDMFVRVTPELLEYQKTSATKFTIPANASDVTEMGMAMAKFADFVAFFEARGTRPTEFYVVAVKIGDAFTLLRTRKARDLARATAQSELDALKAKPTTGLSDAEKARLATQIDQQERAIAILDEQKLERSANPTGPYQLSDAEIDLVRARYDEIEALHDQLHGKSSVADPL